MKWMTRPFTLTLPLTLFVALACGSGDQGLPSEVGVEQGAAVFRDPKASPTEGNALACADCHATSGQASDRRFPGADLSGATLRSTFWGGQENDLLRSTNYCRAYFMRAEFPWAAEEQDARNLYAYLESLSGPAAAVPFTPVREIVPPQCVAGDDAAGARLYELTCQHCHGTAHEGAGRKSASPILPEEVLFNHGLLGHCDAPANTAPSIFLSKVRHGVFFDEGGTMPPFSTEVLTDADIVNLFSYLGLGPTP